MGDAVTEPTMVGVIWAGPDPGVREKIQALLGDGYVATFIDLEERIPLGTLPVLDGRGIWLYLVCKVPEGPVAAPATAPTLVGVIWDGSIAETRRKVQALLGDGHVVTYIRKEDLALLDALPVLGDRGAWPYLVCKTPPTPTTEPTMVGIVWAGTVAEARQKVEILHGDGYIITFIPEEELAFLDALPVLHDRGPSPYLVCTAPPMPVVEPTMVGIVWGGPVAETRQKLQRLLLGGGYVITYIHKEELALLDTLPVLDDQGKWPYLVCDTQAKPILALPWLTQQVVVPDDPELPIEARPLLVPSPNPDRIGVIWAESVAEARQKVQDLRGDGHVVTYIHKDDWAIFKSLFVLDDQGAFPYLVCKVPDKGHAQSPAK